MEEALLDAATVEFAKRAQTLLPGHRSDDDG